MTVLTPNAAVLILENSEVKTWEDLAALIASMSEEDRKRPVVFSD